MYNVACGGQAQYLASAPTALFEGSTNARSARIHTRDDGRNIAAHTDTVSTDIIQTTEDAPIKGQKEWKIEHIQPYLRLKFRADGKRQQ